LPASDTAAFSVRVVEPPTRGSGASGVGRGAQPAEVDGDAPIECLGLAPDVVRGGEVLDRDAERLEERALVARLPSRRRADQHLSELGDDVIVADRALPTGNEDVARLGERRLAAVDIE